MVSQKLRMDFIRPFNFLSEIHSQPKSSSIPDEKLNNKILQTQIQSGTSRKKDKRSLDASCVSAVSEPRSGELCEASTKGALAESHNRFTESPVAASEIAEQFCAASSRALREGLKRKPDSEWWTIQDLNL